MDILLCASSRCLSDEFFEAATKIGDHIGKKKHGLIYGGGNIGLMGEVARAAATAGSSVKGYIPPAFHKAAPDLPHETITTHLVENLFVRKEKMLFDSDLLLVFPGGLGTLDEGAEGAAANDIQCYIDSAEALKPVVILNLKDKDGIPYYRGLKLQLEDMVRNGAMDASRMKMFHFAESVDEAIKLLDDYAHQGFPPVVCTKDGWNPSV